MFFSSFETCQNIRHSQAITVHAHSWAWLEVSSYQKLLVILKVVILTTHAYHVIVSCGIYTHNKRTVSVCEFSLSQRTPEDKGGLGTRWERKSKWLFVSDHSTREVRLLFITLCVSVRHFSCLRDSHWY